MKNFIVENWFKLVLSVCLLICSVGFLMQSSKPVQAQAGGVKAVGAIKMDNGGIYVVWSDGVCTPPTSLRPYR
ncbi:MAG: hypothetical protein ACKOAV_04760 [Bacteroidota bacterium]